ncbi:ubiquitin carboxyl-terminal hydrolase 15 isoform 2, partial [Nannochloropsis gaditana]
PLPGRRGSVGLVNLGNTCYLNSAVQCLAHTLPLTRYFLAHRLAEDLNPSSPLGSGGRVARAYERLVKEMWFGEARVCNPQALKAAVTRFSPPSLLAMPSTTPTSSWSSSWTSSTRT